MLAADGPHELQHARLILNKPALFNYEPIVTNYGAKVEVITRRDTLSPFAVKCKEKRKREFPR